MPFQSSVVRLDDYRKRASRPVGGSHLLSAALARQLELVPPRPAGLGACVSHLQQDAAVISAHPAQLRTLLRLKDAMFRAPGRESQMEALWGASVAAAVLAARLARTLGLDAGLAAGAGLLHRAGDVWAVSALARAEQAVGVIAPEATVLPAVTARDIDLAARLASSWALAPDMTSAMTLWRQWPEDAPTTPTVRGVVYFAHLLASEVVWPLVCTPGVVDAAAEEGGVPAALVEDARNQFPSLQDLLAALR